MSIDVAKTFEAERKRLRKVAHRMLGSQAEADDAVQEAWLHVARADTSAIENMPAWLTTVVARVCLDMLRSRKSRREDPVDDAAPSSLARETVAKDPESDVVLADSVGVALMIVLDMLDPAERIAFVLHDLFGMSFDEIAPVVGKSSEAARQLASRARRRVHGAPTENRAGQRKVAEAFLTALRAGDMAGLLAVLDPDVVVTFGAQETRGAQNWVKGAVQFGHLARAVSLALVDGTPGLIWAPHGKLQRALSFTIENGIVKRIEIIGDPAAIAKLEIGVP
jgi:RNA polymerase sigma factor (sigma-70 family)